MLLNVVQWQLSYFAGKIQNGAAILEVGVALSHKVKDVIQ